MGRVMQDVIDNAVKLLRDEGTPEGVIANCLAVALVDCTARIKPEDIRASRNPYDYLASAAVRKGC